MSLIGSGLDERNMGQSVGSHRGKAVLRAEAPDPGKRDVIRDPVPLKKPRLLPVGVVAQGHRFETPITERTGIVLAHGQEDIGDEVIVGKSRVRKRMIVPVTRVRWDDTGEAVNVSRHMVVRVQ